MLIPIDMLKCTKDCREGRLKLFTKKDAEKG